MQAIANALRIASAKTDTKPSDAQKESGNYAKGKVRIHGLDVAIENPKGSDRFGVGKDGKRWAVKMPSHYGYVKGTEGKDGDAVDVYIGPTHDSNKVFVVDQINAESGRFDEHKAMLSYQNKDAALADYHKAFSDGKAKDRIGSVTEMSTSEFKSWLKSDDTKKPLGDLRKSYANGGKIDMPLDKSGTKKSVGRNISELMSSGRKKAQAIAIALDVARRGRKGKASGGRVGYWDGGSADDDMTTADIRREMLRMPERSTGPELRAYNPTWRDRLGQAISDYAPIPNSRRLAHELVGTSGIGDSGNMSLGDVGVNSVLDAADKTSQGRYFEAAMDAAPLAFPLARPVARGAKAALAAIPAGLSVPSAAGLGMFAMPSSAADTTTLDRLLAQKDALSKQRAAAQSERDKQAAGDKTSGIKPGRGPNYTASMDELRRLDEQSSKLDGMIAEEMRRNSSEGMLQAERERKAFEEQERAKEYGKPIREHLSPALANAVPAISTAAGIAAMAAMKGRYNKEYGRALESYLTAEKAGDVPGMALRSSQLAKLESPSIGSKIATGAAAGLPLELRLAELAIDAKQDPNSRAYKEAMTRIHDPYALAFDFGTAGISSLLAGGLGSKFAPHQPDRSLGKTIASGQPYASGPAIADDYGAALSAGESLRRLRQNEPAALSPPANPIRSISAPVSVDPIEGALDVARRRSSPEITSANDLSKLRGVGERFEPPLPGNRSPALEVPSSPHAKTSPAPEPTVTDTQFVLPPGWKRDKNGIPYDAHNGQKIKKTHYTPREDEAPAAKSANKSEPKVEPAKGNGAAPHDDLPEIVPGSGIVKKPVKDFDPNDPTNRGMAKGGAVKNALALARKYANGGKVHVGPVVGATGGRADKLPISVPSGAYVLPSDTVSSLGGGNSLAGMQSLTKMFGKSSPRPRADGGAVPIKISDGEFVVSPEQVAKVGSGDMARGHTVLDAFVKKVRAQHIDTLKSLPGPSR